MSTRRLVRMLDLHDQPTSIADYEGHHAANAVWPDVITHIRAQGVLDMEIWRFADRLVMIMEVAEDYPRAVPEPAAVEAWERLMDGFQRRLADSPEKWAPASRIFALVEQGSGTET